MKPWVILSAMLLITTLALPQEVKLVEDESCGCDIYYVDGLETTKADGYYGFRKEDGTQIVPNIYKHVGRFTGGYCRVMKDDKFYGLIDNKGRELVPCLYDLVEYPSEGRIQVVKDGLVGYYDMQGQLVIPCCYLGGYDFSEGCAGVAVALTGDTPICTYIDTLGHELFPPQYETFRLRIRLGDAISAVGRDRPHWEDAAAHYV